jgi:hypothetical protein
MRRSVLGIALLAVGACSYGFAGGGLPRELRTVAVLPFENRTPDPTVAQEVNRAVRDAVEQRLGLRGSTEAQADVVVRGTVTVYEPDQPVGYRGTGQGTGGRAAEVEVSKRLLQLRVEIEMVERSSGRNLLRSRSFSVDAQYDPGRESNGRRDALELLQNRLVEEAQSQW